MIVYADTSALAKLLLDEDGSEEMIATTARAELLGSAAIAYIELRAALAAAIRDGRIAAGLRHRIVQALERVWEGVSEVTLDRPLLRDAGDLAERMQLRGYDAVHLAALQELGSPDAVTFACWDSELRRAAHALGYAVVPRFDA